MSPTEKGKKKVNTIVNFKNLIAFSSTFKKFLERLLKSLK